MFRTILIFLFTIFLLACSSNVTVASSETTQAITNATLAYVKNHSAISYAKVNVVAIVQSGDYARVRIDPVEPITDSAFAFLKNTQQGWGVISMGTAFDKTFYKKYQIPEKLQL